jgi:hypothetical protein
MSLQERYARLEQILEETNWIINEQYCCHAEEMEERHKANIKISVITTIKL